MANFQVCSYEGLEQDILELLQAYPFAMMCWIQMS